MPRLPARPLAAVVALFAVAVAAGQKAPPKKPGDKDKAPTIKEIMLKSHKNSDAPLNTLPKAAKGGRWDEAAAAADEFVKGGEDLVKAGKPKKGTAESWAKLTKEYLDATKEAKAAVGKKDAKAVTEAMSTFADMCKSCHSAHR